MRAALYSSMNTGTVHFCDAGSVICPLKQRISDETYRNKKSFIDLFLIIMFLCFRHFGLTPLVCAASRF